jgi:hypothetical protein
MNKAENTIKMGIAMKQNLSQNPYFALNSSFSTIKPEAPNFFPIIRLSQNSNFWNSLIYKKSGWFLPQFSMVLTQTRRL